ncbi:MAG: T9SS type A sorting domain-containing protein [Flavipsychrobacter sp.]|nr:T9SS type A sorting domain-containing protein [Flavipsychrobacter sp.]
MKKLILSLSVILCIGASNEANAQFTLAKDTAKGVASDYGLKVTNTLTNTSGGTIQVDWKILSHNIPTTGSNTWYVNFGLCDNKLCYDNSILSGAVTQTTFDIPAAGNMPFYISYTNAIASATTFGPYYVSVELSQGSNKDTATFIMNKWTTGISNTATKNADNIVVYPNPAGDDVNVVFTGMNEVKTIGIYNLIGKMVSVYKVSGTSANMNVANVPSGIYLIRLMDNQGHVVATRKFNKQ